MNLLLLCSSYHPRIGGAESYALTLAEGMVAQGHRVLVVTDCVGGAPESELLGGVEVMRLHQYRAALSAPEAIPWEQMQFSLLPELANAAREWDIDLIHANGHESAVLGSMLSLDIDAPLVCTFHEQSPEQGALGAGRCRFIYQHLPVAMFLPGSHFYGAQALAAGADPRRVCVVHHGIDHGVFASSDRGLARRRLGLDPTAPTVVCAARISPRKGLSYLLDAVAVLRMTIPDIRCIIAGTCNSGSQALLESLLARRRELGLDDSVQIRDDLSHTQMPLLFAAADVVAQPSLAEGLGLAVLEAMACGRAVVGSDIPGIDEVIRPGKTGLLVPPADSASLAATISTLLMDERLRTQLAEAGQQAVADHFSVHRMLSEIESAYQAVVDGAAGRR